MKSGTWRPNDRMRSGIMCANFRRRRCFAAGERQLIELFAQQAAIALQIARLGEQEQN